jgi:AbrB family looped-hinge helix DNA binding protein
MSEKSFVEVVLRPKRQITLSKKICDQLGISPGDVLELTIRDSTIIAKPRKTLALEALKEIRRTFQRSGISEEELLKTGRRIRQEVAGERYEGQA